MDCGIAGIDIWPALCETTNSGSFHSPTWMDTDVSVHLSFICVDWTHCPEVQACGGGLIFSVVPNLLRPITNPQSMLGVEIWDFDPGWGLSESKKLEGLGKNRHSWMPSSHGAQLWHQICTRVKQVNRLSYERYQSQGQSTRMTSGWEKRFDYFGDRCWAIILEYLMYWHWGMLVILNLNVVIAL